MSTPHARCREENCTNNETWCFMCNNRFISFCATHKHKSLVKYSPELQQSWSKNMCTLCYSKVYDIAPEIT